MKTKPECHDETKEFCEKMWIPEAPFWKDVNCETKTWENCTLVPHPHPVEIDYCTCDNTEIWYNSFERNNVNVDCLSTVCEPKVVRYIVDFTSHGYAGCAQVHADFRAD